VFDVSIANVSGNFALRAELDSNPNDNINR